MRVGEAYERIPFRLVFSKDLALCVIANVADLGEAANVELCGAELRHDGGSGLVMATSWLSGARCRGSNQKFEMPSIRDFLMMPTNQLLHSSAFTISNNRLDNLSTNSSA